MIIANNIKTTIPQTESAKEYLMFVEECFCSMDKPLVGTLMAQLITMKYDGSRGMQEHIIELAKDLKQQPTSLRRRKNLPVNVSNGDKKEQMADKCHFCKKGHYQKDFQKHKAWFEKKGKFYVFVCFELNLIEVHNNT
ncbi:hypothetical protein ES319_D05G364200v1 [Gossypium barbadense]|uniref:Uncharacterized protein n=3 Tax=Gossypium TaxID=3633 RepID=A0A5J5RLN0_GOSBA|nr:hypothetical protein ES319_D05G364200v1 [Gossypium barbadense]TYG71345.1 hypothetical protein ES288_D05G389300v1 [Gossypium darwinii]TYH74254.1 hypothetical protein ES332_D05G386900v1 [Gossypium tomentosum]